MDRVLSSRSDERRSQYPQFWSKFSSGTSFNQHGRPSAPIVTREILFRVLLLLICSVFGNLSTVQATTHVQQASTSDVSGAQYRSMSATLSSPTTAGNAIVIGVTYGNVNPTISASDTQGNLYSQAINTYDSAHRQGCAILYATNIHGGSGDQVTVNFGSSVAYLAMGIHEYSGIAASSALDAISGNLGSGSSLSSAPATTTASGDLIFSCGVEDALGRGDTFTAGSGFAMRVNLGSVAAYADEDRIQSSAGAVAATWTLSPASSWIAAMAAFRPVGATPPTSTAPVITALSPNSGPVGTNVTISGSNFGSVNDTVLFNGTTASVTSWSATSIVAVVPNGSTSGNVTVKVGGQTSNGVNFSVSGITVSVSPSSWNLQLNQSASFTATVQNDPSNKEVNWSLSGSGCSGTTCGTLANITSNSVTYTAPGSVPTGTVLLTARSVSDTTKAGSSTITVSKPADTSSTSTPMFARNHVSGSNTQGYATTAYSLRLPNATLSGNCVIVGFQYGSTSGVTPSVTDDKGNSYAIVAKHDDGNQVVNLAVALNVAAGAQRITVSFSGTAPPYVSGLASEFYNVATSNAIDGTTGNNGTSTSVTAGSLTPASSGDLIYQYSVQDSTSNPMISWSQGSSWTLLSADVMDSTAAQYQVQSSAAAINPTMGMSPSQNFNSIAIALKPATAGTAPPPGIRVNRVQHNSIPAWAASPVRLQFPCTGNLLVVSWIGVENHDITAVSDGNGNSYTSAGAPFGLNQSGDNQLYYAASAVTNTNMMGPYLSTTGTDISGSTAVLFDVDGAAASPYDSIAGRRTASGLQSSSGNITAASITPSTANSLIITSIGVTSNTVNGVSPGYFLPVVPAPIKSPNPVDQNNGWALYYSSGTSPMTFIWTAQDGPVDYWASIAVVFKGR